jgi:hypothetical protein
MEKRQLLQQICWEKVVIYLQKIETRSMLVTQYEYQLKVADSKDFTIRPKTLQLVHKRAETTLETIDIDKNFLSPATKRKDGQMGLHGIKKLLHIKRNGL